MVNDTDFSIDVSRRESMYEKWYVSWIWVVMWQFIYFSGGSKSRLVHSRLLRGQLRICQNTNYADQGAQNVLCPKLSTGIVQVAGVLVPWLVSLGESTNSTSCPKDSCAVGILVSTVLCPRNIFSWDSKTCKFELLLKFTLGFVVWPGAGMWVCWDRGCEHYPAKRSNTHAGVENIEPWQSLTAILL